MQAGHSAPPSSVPHEIPLESTLLAAIQTEAPAIPTIPRVVFDEESLPTSETLLSVYPDPPLTAGWDGHLRHVSASDFTYDDFFRNHLLSNRPVLIQGVSHSWLSTAEWIEKSNESICADGQVAVDTVKLDVLERLFGRSQVLVSDCSGEPGTEMTLKEYVEYLSTCREAGRREVRSFSSAVRLVRPERLASAARPSRPARPRPRGRRDCALEAGETAPSLEAGEPWKDLKDPQALVLRPPDDWQPVPCHVEGRACPVYGAYQTPAWFADDWLNWYHDRQRAEGDEALQGVKCADYRFLYLGPAGSSTPLHSDVLRSYSWSVNVCGRKRWVIWPSSDTIRLFDKHGHEMPQDAETASPNDFPHLGGTRPLKVIQEAGDAIFIPSGWHHQVLNLEETLSINHNWLNACNVNWTWQLLRREHATAEVLIADCRPLTTPEDFQELCQRNLKANSGMDYRGLFNFLESVAAAELMVVQRHISLAVSPVPCPGSQSSTSEENTPTGCSAGAHLVSGRCGAGLPTPELSPRAFFESLADSLSAIPPSANGGRLATCTIPAGLARGGADSESPCTSSPAHEMQGTAGTAHPSGTEAAPGSPSGTLAQAFDPTMEAAVGSAGGSMEGTIAGSGRGLHSAARHVSRAPAEAELEIPDESTTGTHSELAQKDRAALTGEAFGREGGCTASRSEVGPMTEARRTRLLLAVFNLQRVQAVLQSMGQEDYFHGRGALGQTNRPDEGLNVEQLASLIEISLRTLEWAGLEEKSGM
ncbi:hypothetical protein CYMTET_17069 [Cymbomonas tetramitiformis]|uniref:JmjC domain-containing protein n=1 Tax=Cymbomonas tetramitiformis TaxID=36881 RepID=A0AAE0L7N7_9CHLO|nr:hypothetical protein CYMTET_17069 [Cymbomonas tetramitiformis]